MKNITFIFFILLASPLYANGDKLYRADSRPPDEIKRSGGLMPRGNNEYFDRGTQMNINLYDHARGTQTGFVRVFQLDAEKNTPLTAAKQIELV